MANNSSVNGFDARLHQQGLERSGSCCVTQSVSHMATIALFVIGCMAVAGAFPGGSTLGWTTVGLAGGAYVIDLAYGNVSKRKSALRIDTLATMVFLTVGILGGIGQLSMTQLGWAIVGTTISKYFLRACCGSSFQGSVPTGYKQEVKYD